MTWKYNSLAVQEMAKSHVLYCISLIKVYKPLTLKTIIQDDDKFAKNMNMNIKGMALRLF